MENKHCQVDCYVAHKIGYPKLVVVKLPECCHLSHDVQLCIQRKLRVGLVAYNLHELFESWVFKHFELFS